MQYRLYLLALLILCGNSFYASDKAEQSLITRENIGLFVGITTLCGIGLVLYKFEAQIIKWLDRVLFPITKNAKNKTDKDQRQESENNSDDDFDFSERENENDDISKKTEKYKRQKNDGISPLHMACHENDTKKVQFLVPSVDSEILNAKYYYHRSFGWYPFSKTRQKTALFMACEKQNIAIVDALLSRKDIDVNTCCDYDFTALYIACYKGNLAIVKKLLRNKNIDINKGEQNPLACVYMRMFRDKSPKHKDIFLLLLQQDEIDPTGALALACFYNDMDTFKILLKHQNTQKFLKNNHALYAACKNGNVEMVRVLLKLNVENCMDINALVDDVRFYTKHTGDSSQQYYNPLHIACKRGAIADNENYIEIIKLLLLEPYVDVNKQTGPRSYGKTPALSSGTGFTALHLAATHEKLLELLLKKDFTCINTEAYVFQDRKNKRWPWLYITRDTKRGRSTPLYIAIKAANVACVNLLLRYGADMSVKSGGYTLFELVCEKTREDCCYHSVLEALISHLDTNIKICFSRALGLAIPDNALVNKSTLKFLLEHTHPNEKIPHLSSDTNEKYKNHFSLPIIKAARRNLNVLNIFINQYNGDCYLYNHRGNTPLFIAFMAEKITDFCEIDYFRKLDSIGRTQLMEQELALIAQSNPIRRAKIINKSNYLREKKDIEKNIKRLNLFVEKCVAFGGIEISKIDSFLPAVYSQMQSVTHSDNCRYNQPLCCCNYNEVVMHAFLLHGSDRTDKDQRINQEIAREYRNKPLEYYSKVWYEKKPIKEYFASQL